jgi:thiamine biosynthesis lipoprotein
MLKNGIKSAIINLGGNILVIGAKEDGTTWNVGIQDPVKARGEFALTINVINKSVVTSGDYERYFEEGGKRYHHIINPRTGYPSDSDIISTTIIFDNSIDGDGLSTGVYIMGVKKAIELIEEIKGVDAIFITKNKEIYVTDGIRGNITTLNNEFIYKNRI